MTSPRVRTLALILCAAMCCRAETVGPIQNQIRELGAKYWELIWATANNGREMPKSAIGAQVHFSGVIVKQDNPLLVQTTAGGSTISCQVHVPDADFKSIVSNVETQFSVTVFGTVKALDPKNRTAEIYADKCTLH